MAAFVVQYDKDRRLCREIVEFPNGAERAAGWNGERYQRLLGKGYEVRVILASIREYVALDPCCAQHGPDKPVPFRRATAEELALSSHAAFEAAGL